MNGVATVRASLVPFGAGKNDLESINVELTLRGTDLLSLCFVAAGEIARLKIPGGLTPRRNDRLWEHTCFEVFIRSDENPNYYEFNFSPSGEWAAYAFSAYRNGASFDEYNCSPETAFRRSSTTIELAASIALQPLQLRADRLVRVGLSAGIESVDGELGYWAMRHPAPKPDFHHADSFALELRLPGDPSGKRLQ